MGNCNGGNSNPSSETSQDDSFTLGHDTLTASGSQSGEKYKPKTWDGILAGHIEMLCKVPKPDDITVCGERDIWSNNRLCEYNGFVPMYLQYTEKNPGKSFYEYWKFLHELGIPGFPNPDGTKWRAVFTPACIGPTLQKYGNITIDWIIKEYLNWQPSRDPVSYNAFIAWQQETTKLYETCSDRVKYEVWGSEYCHRETLPDGHFTTSINEDMDPPTHVAAENPFPKMTKNILSMIVWELPGCESSLYEIKDRVLSGDIEIPGLSVEEVNDRFIENGCWVNDFPSIKSLRHYHFLFRMDYQNLDAATARPERGTPAESPSADGGHGGRRRLQQMLGA